MRNNITKYVSISIIAFLSLIMVSFAATPSGVAFSSVNQSHVFAYLNSTTYINYTITVYNGTASNITLGSSVLYPKGISLARYGIDEGFIPSSGTPPFSGKIRFHVNANATPGNYNITLSWSPQMASTHGFAVIYLTVYNKTKPTTSTTTVATTSTVSPVSNTTVPTTTPTTVSPTTPTTVPTTIPTTPSSSTISLEYIIAAIIIIIIIAIIVYLAVRHHNRY